MIKRKPESLAFFIVKYYDLKDAIKGQGTINVRKKFFKITAQIKPSINSDTYTVCFCYFIGGKIDVWVEGLLQKGNGIVPPHIYHKNVKEDKVKLCLYMPNYHEYDSNKLLTANILPWTCEWLYFYELFLITKNWFGNGIHPK